MNLRDQLDPLAAAATAVLCASWGSRQVTIKIFGATLLHERVSLALAAGACFRRLRHLAGQPPPAARY